MYTFVDISFGITPDVDPYTIEMGEKFLQKLIDTAEHS